MEENSKKHKEQREREIQARMELPGRVADVSLWKSHIHGTWTETLGRGIPHRQANETFGRPRPESLSRKYVFTAFITFSVESD